MAGPSFADQDGVVFVGDGAEFTHGVVNFGEFFVVGFDLVGAAEFVGAGGGRIVGERGAFVEGVDGVEAESGNAPLVPEAGDVEHGFFYCGITPVQVWLLGIKIVVIVLICFGIESPTGRAEGGEPVVGRLIRAFAVFPDVPIAVLGSF